MKRKILRKIKIQHISRVEGHAGFIGYLLDGDVPQAKIEIEEGARLIEGILIGRHFSEAPIITARICGICPVIHNLTSIKAIENALEIKVRPEVILLRKLLLAAQIIQSHTLHLFFLFLPDFLSDFQPLADPPSVESQIKKYPAQAKAALDIRNFGNKIIEIVGGRAIHPIITEIGGFKKYPKKLDLLVLYHLSGKILSEAVNLANFFKKLKYPEFYRPTNFASLHSPKEYAFYDGKIKWQTSNEKEKLYEPKIFLQQTKEIETLGEVVKRVQHNQQAYMVGALARVNDNSDQLNSQAKKIWRGLIKQPPVRNTFYNIFAQAVEVVHFIEESQKLLKKLTRTSLDNRSIKNTRFKIKPGMGLAACEAPRGTLYHAYEIDKNGLIKKCNIITPTAQFLNNIEADLKVWLKQIRRLSKKEQERKIKMLIRAYDPCITCATH